ncbi:HET-domain-containing protein, partial [Ganoderma leucocontextum]
MDADKIRNACVVARAHGFRYIWIDSCCIDKTSISEAINSMFSWYRKSAICYAYLADVPAVAAHEKFPQSRWFTRGWTLQELIAPRHLVFLTSEWRTMGTKTTLAWKVEKITGIDYLVLVDRQSLDDVGVARRMSWASKRQTTRVEDEAYSLLGIFNIKMPTVYGEGRGAFRRLQEEIMRRIPDQSIFALGGILAATFPLLSSDTHLDGEHPKDPDGFMATSPRDFHLSGSIRPVPLDEFSRRCGNVSNLPLIGFTSSPYGICVEFPMIPFCECIEPNYIARLPHSRGRLPHLWLVLLACEHAAHPGCLLARVC